MNLQIRAKTIDGRWLSLNDTISMDYQASRFIPCDSLEVTLLAQHQNENFCELTASLDNFIFFEGIVDKQTLSFSKKGNLLMINCRNKTAWLVDNEVKPYIYFQLTSSELFKQYALPFGVLSHEFPYEAKKNFIQVKKGMSNWNVIEEFCRLVYQKTPYINQDRKLVLNPINATIHTLSNHHSGATLFPSLQIKRLNYKLISRLFLKTATETYGYFYGVVLENENAKQKQVKRDRYYHSSNKLSASAKAEAEQIIKESNRNSYLVSVTVPLLMSARVGDQVKLYHDAISQSNLVIIGMRYIINEKGLQTQLDLADKQYI